MRHLTLVILAFLVVGCTKEVGRVDFADAGTNGSYAPVPGGHLDLWTKVDIAFDDDVGAMYHVKLLDGTNVVAETDCNPFDTSTKMAHISTVVGDHHTERYRGKMRCSFDVPVGSYDAVAELTFFKRPASLEVRHMDLVFKQ